MSDARRDALIQAAREATRAYFDRQAAETRGLSKSVGVEAAEAKVAGHAADRIAKHILEP
jgi:hypothetical protein